MSKTRKVKARAPRSAARYPYRLPGSRYPCMEPGECYSASTALAQVYSELRYVEGTRTFTVRVEPDGHTASSTVDHAWNVTPGGEIWDSTLDLGMRIAAQRGQVEITYVER